MKTFDVKTPYATYKNCRFIKSTYTLGGALALQIWNDDDGPIATITVNLDVIDGIGAYGDLSYVDTNNCPWAERLITELGIGEHTDTWGASGFCVYPLYKFNLEKIKEYSLVDQ